MNDQVGSTECCKQKKSHLCLLNVKYLYNAKGVEIHHTHTPHTPTMSFPRRSLEKNMAWPNYMPEL